MAKYTKEEFLQIIRNAKERKRLWQEETRRELDEMHAEIMLNKNSRTITL